MEPKYIIILDYNHGNVHIFKLSAAQKVNIKSSQNPELLVAEFCHQLHIGYDECNWMISDHCSVIEHPC